MSPRVDALVVGSGPGGAVTARTLAAAGLDVLVVEEGEWVDAGSLKPYSVDQLQHQYRNGGLTVALGRPSIAYTEGCGAGGGSEVNSGLYHRPPGTLLAEWSAACGIEDLTSSALAPAHAFVERELSVAPWPAPRLPDSSEVLRRGAETLGWKGLDVPRWACYTVTDGVVAAERQTMTRTYLPRAQDDGADVWTACRADRLRLSGGHVRSVDVVRRVAGRAHRERIVADHVFVCAGATQTPALLQRSGVRHNVGNNLSVHPTVKVVAEFDHEVNTDKDLPTYQVKEFGSWLTLGGSASRPSLIALALSENWPEFSRAFERWPRQIVYYASIQSVGRGRVRALPGFRDPLVTYRLTREDVARLRSGLGRLLHLLLAAGAVAVYPSYAGAPRVTDAPSATEAVRGLARANASLMTVHLTGTAAMGEETSRTAVDSYGRVHGVDNLRVNDASMLPWAPGVNPQGSVMAIAHRNVDAFLAAQGVPAPPMVTG